MLNAGERPVAFMLPATAPEERWETLLDTADPWAPPRRLRAGGRYELLPRSMAVLKLNCRKEDFAARTTGVRWGLLTCYVHGFRCQCHCASTCTRSSCQPRIPTVRVTADELS